MKYVIFEEPSGVEYPIVFPDLVKHDFIVQCVNTAYPGIKPISAGFCNVSGEAWGKSISLNMKSRPIEDRWYLKKLFDGL